MEHESGRCEREFNFSDRDPNRIVSSVCSQHILQKLARMLAIECFDERFEERAFGNKR